MADHLAWPDLQLAAWAPTKRSLHAYAQMLGKLRLALAPHQPNFLFTALTLTARGFTTGAIPYGTRSLEASLDIFDATIRIASSDDRQQRIPIDGERTIAGVFAAFHAALAALDVDVTISPIPQEVADTTPFDTDRRPATFDRTEAERWFTVVTATSAIFDRWRAHFFGRSALALWWGAFDYAVMLFSGKHVEAPVGRGYLYRYDLDAEMFNVGFYPGDDANAAYFYGYLYPSPATCATIALAPPEASWSERLGEWVLPYEAVRTAPDPERMLVAFLDAIYGVCGTDAGWDRAQFTYVPPPLRRGR